MAGEIAKTLAAPARTARGEARFAASSADSALRLRCADNLYALIGHAPAGPHRGDLAALGRALAALPVQAVCAQAGLQLMGLRAHVSASRSGKHSYSRFEAAAAVLPALCAALPLVPGTPEAHDVAFRLDIDGNQASFSVKLTDAAFRFRGLRQFSSAAIRPTIAAALIRLTDPQADDVFLDPFCGSGTILSERLSLPHAQVLGGDTDEAALAAAAQNTAGRVRLQRWDALALPLDTGSVTAIATNPPWGNQIALADSAELYHGFLREARRVLSPGGRLVVLSDRTDDMAAALAACGLPEPQPLIVSLHGTLCRVWSLQV